MNRKRIIEDLTLSVCGLLSDLKCIYDLERDNRGGERSSYIFVRKPVSMKIRVSAHRSHRIEKDIERSRIPVFDVGPHAMALTELTTAIVPLMGATPDGVKGRVDD